MIAQCLLVRLPLVSSGRHRTLYINMRAYKSQSEKKKKWELFIRVVRCVTCAVVHKYIRATKQPTNSAVHIKKNSLFPYTHNNTEICIANEYLFALILKAKHDAEVKCIYLRGCFRFNCMYLYGWLQIDPLN